MAETFTQRTAVDPTRSGEQLRLISQWANGSPICVQYYAQNLSNVEATQHASEITGYETVHTSLMKIKYFEIRLTGDMSFSFNSTLNESDYEGEAILYPGFKPSIGDTFLYGVGGGRVGIFKVDEIARLTMQQYTYHKISFSFVEFLSHGAKTKLENRVTRTVFFDKQKFLSDDISLFSETGYNTYHECRRLRYELMQYYFKEFYNGGEYSSLIRPDGVYDPYVVEYMNRKVSYRDYPVKSKQLVTDLRDYHNSFWYVLIDKRFKDMTKVSTTYKIRKMTYGFLDVSTNELADRKYVELCKPQCDLHNEDDHEAYIFDQYYSYRAEHPRAEPADETLVLLSNMENVGLMGVTPNGILQSEYSFFGGEMTPALLKALEYESPPVLDLALYVALHKRLLPSQFHDVIEMVTAYRDLEPMAAFYHIPIYLHLLDMVILSAR